MLWLVAVSKIALVSLRIKAQIIVLIGFFLCPRWQPYQPWFRKIHTKPVCPSESGYFVCSKTMTHWCPCTRTRKWVHTLPTLPAAPGMIARERRSSSLTTCSPTFPRAASLTPRQRQDTLQLTQYFLYYIHTNILKIVRLYSIFIKQCYKVLYK